MRDGKALRSRSLDLVGCSEVRAALSTAVHLFVLKTFCSSVSSRVKCSWQRLSHLIGCIGRFTFSKEVENVTEGSWSQSMALGRLNPRLPATWLVLVGAPEWQIVGSAPYSYRCTALQASQAPCFGILYGCLRCPFRIPQDNEYGREETRHKRTFACQHPCESNALTVDSSVQMDTRFEECRERSSERGLDNGCQQMGPVVPREDGGRSRNESATM